MKEETITLRDAESTIRDAETTLKCAPLLKATALVFALLELLVIKEVITKEDSRHLVEEMLPGVLAEQAITLISAITMAKEALARRN